MFKLTYVVSRAGHPSHIPLAVSGRNGMAYGHALWDQKAQAHVFRFTKEQWEGGADKEVLKRANRGSAVWMVRAEVEMDGESPVGQLSQELDAVRSELQETKRRLEATQQEYAALAAAAQKPEEATDATNPTPDTTEPAGEPPGAAEGGSDASLTDARLGTMRFNELVQEAKELNSKGATLDLTALNTKVKLREALLDWHNSQPADPAPAP